MKKIEIMIIAKIKMQKILENYELKNLELKTIKNILQQMSFSENVTFLVFDLKFLVKKSKNEK